MTAISTRPPPTAAAGERAGGRVGVIPGSPSGHEPECWTTRCAAPGPYRDLAALAAHGVPVAVTYDEVEEPLPGGEDETMPRGVCGQCGRGHGRRGGCQPAAAPETKSPTRRRRPAAAAAPDDMADRIRALEAAVARGEAAARVLAAVRAALAGAARSDSA